MRKEAWSQLLTAARWRDTPASAWTVPSASRTAAPPRSARLAPAARAAAAPPRRPQAGRPARERAFVPRGRAVVDRPAEGVRQERLGEHPDDSEQHPEC